MSVAAERPPSSGGMDLPLLRNSMGAAEEGEAFLPSHEQYPPDLKFPKFKYAASMADLVYGESDILDYCSIMGLLPESAALKKSSRDRIVTLWSSFILQWFYFGCGALSVLYGITVSYSETSRSDQIATQCYYLGVLVQNCMLYYAAHLWRESLTHKRLVPIPLFREAYKVARRYSDAVLYVVGFVTCCFYALLYHANRSLPISERFYLMMGITALVLPTTFMTAGMLTMLIVEQRCSLSAVETLKEYVGQGQRLSSEVYLALFDITSQRTTQNAPCVNMVVMSTIWNTVCMVILVFVESRELLDADVFFALFSVFYSVIFFGRQAWVLALYLATVGEVNQSAEVLPRLLVRQHWSTNHTDFIVELPTLLMQQLPLELQGRATAIASATLDEQERLTVLSAMQYCPLGSTILSLRPTVWQLRLQVFFFFTAFLLSMLRAVLIASLQIV